MRWKTVPQTSGCHRKCSVADGREPSASNSYRHWRCGTQSLSGFSVCWSSQCVRQVNTRVRCIYFDSRCTFKLHFHWCLDVFCRPPDSQLMMRSTSVFMYLCSDYVITKDQRWGTCTCTCTMLYLTHLCQGLRNPTYRHYHQQQRQHL